MFFVGGKQAVKIAPRRDRKIEELFVAVIIQIPKRSIIEAHPNNVLPRLLRKLRRATRQIYHLSHQIRVDFGDKLEKLQIGWEYWPQNHVLMTVGRSKEMKEWSRQRQQDAQNAPTVRNCRIIESAPASGAIKHQPRSGGGEGMEG